VEKRQNRAIRDFIVASGYLPDEGIYMASEGARHAYLHRDAGINVDVFADEFYFCHRIPFKGRLESCARIGALLHLHHELETRPRLTLAWRGGAPRHPRPNRRFARGNRGGAEDAWLEDALQDRNAKPLVPRGLREVATILIQRRRCADRRPLSRKLEKPKYGYRYNGFQVLRPSCTTVVFARPIESRAASLLRRDLLEGIVHVDAM